MAQSNFDKRDCSHCLKKTWHFRSGPDKGFECPCQTALTGPLKTPKTPITYSPSEDLKAPYQAPRRKPERVDEISTIPAIWIPRPERHPLQVGQICKGCGEKLGAFFRSGSIISGLGYREIEGVKSSPILGTIETPWGVHFIGGEEIHTRKRISFVKREKGMFCADCSSCTKRLTDSRGTEHLLIKLDFRALEVPEEKFSRYEIPQETPLANLKIDGRAYNALMHHEKSSGRPSDEIAPPAHGKSRGSYGSDYIGRS